MTLSKKLLSILACPDCHGDLAYTKKASKESLKCKRCRRVYEVKNGIPIMLPKGS